MSNVTELLTRDIEAEDPRTPERLDEWCLLRSDLNLVFSNYKDLRLIENGVFADINRHPHRDILKVHGIIAKRYNKRTAKARSLISWIITPYGESLMQYIENWGWLDPK